MVDFIQVGVNNDRGGLNWSQGRGSFLIVVALVLVLLFMFRIVCLFLGNVLVVAVTAVLFFFIFRTTRVELAL